MPRSCEAFVTDTLGRILAATSDVNGFLAAEAEADTRNRFVELEHAVADIFSVSFRGDGPLDARPHTPLAFAEAVPSATAHVLAKRFDLASQQSKGAWWLPEDARIKAGFVNLAARYTTHPSWAMSLCADDHGRYPLKGSPAGFAAWAVLAPFASELLEPLLLRGPESGALTPDDATTRWTAVSDRYDTCGLATEGILATLNAMLPGHGWSRLTPEKQQAAKQALVSALGAAVSAETVKRWRVGQTRDLIERYYAKSKKGPAEARAVLVKAVQPVLAAFFGGDWLSFLDYLGEQPADSETILTSLPQARLYVEASAKVEKVAAEQNLPVAEVSRMLASYLGEEAVESPVQRRVQAIRRYWQALDAADARQAPGMPALKSLVEAHFISPGKPENPFGESPSDDWLPTDLLRDVDALWDGTVFSTKPDRIVSTLSPPSSLQEVLGPALRFWREIGLSCWYICEGPWARTDLSGLRQYYSRDLDALAESGAPVDEALFEDLKAAERSLGPVEQIQGESQAIDAGHGLSISFSTGSGTRRRGFEILRNIVTDHRRGWADSFLEPLLRSSWETPLRNLAEDVNRSIAVRGKPPTKRQLAGMAAKVSNSWFGGDLSATFAAIGETQEFEQARIRLLPHDVRQFCRLVFALLGGRSVPDYTDPSYSAIWTMLTLASKAPKVVQKQELLGREPTDKEAGLDQYVQWPDGLDYDAYLAAVTSARQELSVRSDERRLEASSEHAQSDQTSSTGVKGKRSSEASAGAAAVPAGWYMDTNLPTTLRWWTGTEWTRLTAPSERAPAGWFSDPERSDQLRWWDGTAWTAHTTSATTPGPALARDGCRGRHSVVVDDRPPWEVAGLPCGLTDADFEVARRVARELKSSEVADGKTFEPAASSWARYFKAYGATYPENLARIEQLLAREPLARTEEGWLVYPAIFIPDPSQSHSDDVPVGACSEVGYIGSAWCSLTKSWARRVQERLPQQRYDVTRLAVRPEVREHETSAMVWVPSLDPPSRQRN
jgi:hypothetical protein